MNLSRWTTLLFACLSLPLAACSSAKPTSAPAAPSQAAASSNPKELIVKKWQRSDAGKEAEKIEFAADGSVSGDLGGIGYKGKYKFVDNETVEATITPDLGMQMQTKYKVKVGADELTLTIDDAKSRKDDTSPWQKEADDRARVGTTEKYKRQH